MLIIIQRQWRKHAGTDIKKDLDLTPPPDPSDDLDEGELARLEGEDEWNLLSNCYVEKNVFQLTAYNIYCAVFLLATECIAKNEKLHYSQNKSFAMPILTLDKLSTIYYQKFFRKIADDLQDIKHYLESTPQETKKLLQLFQLRNESHREEKGADNPRFTEIIEFLRSCKESRLVMHIIKVKDQLRTILTDTNYTHVVGEL